MKVIGIVGGIASGKSFVSHCFQRLGARVVDADRIGHDVLRLDEVKHAIRADWGDSVFDSSGEIDRSVMARSVFGWDDASRQRLARLEKITHPRIARRMQEELDRWEQTQLAAAVLDAPVLLKAGWDQFCDVIVFVEADEPLRRSRAVDRGWSESEWRRRESRQLPLSEVRARADEVVDNSGSKENTCRQVEELWRKWGLAHSVGGQRQSQ
jgi:dephospho-CoA kinase